MKMTTVGMDLAKNVIVVHSVNERGKTVLKKALKRDQVLPFFGNLGSVGKPAGARITGRANWRN